METMDRIRELLASLEAELETVETQAEELNKRRAELRRTVSGLRSLLDTGTKAGATSSDVDTYRRTRTDAIVDIVKSANGACVSAKEVTKRLQERDHLVVGQNSVVTLLSRLAKKKNSKIENVPGHGYTYKSESKKN